jgi:hypothetical protein
MSACDEDEVGTFYGRTIGRSRKSHTIAGDRGRARAATRKPGLE